MDAVMVEWPVPPTCSDITPQRKTGIALLVHVRRAENLHNIVYYELSSMPKGDSSYNMSKDALSAGITRTYSH